MDVTCAYEAKCPGKGGEAADWAVARSTAQEGGLGTTTPFGARGRS